MNPIIQKIKPNLIKWRGLIVCCLGLLVIFIAAIVSEKRKDNIVLIGISAVGSSVFATILFNWGVNKILLFKQVMETIDKLDSVSLRMLASTYGMVSPDMQHQDTMRHLANLKIIRSIVFPETLDSGCYLTGIGRYVLETKLRYNKLFPLMFCDMFVIRFLKGYPKEFIKEKKRFKREYLISWEKCFDFFNNLLTEKSLLIHNDAIKSFNVYWQDLINKKNDNIFDVLMNELIIPWKNRADNERRLKSWKFYYNFRVIPFWRFP